MMKMTKLTTLFLTGNGDLISCQTSRSIEIIFRLTLALLQMRFQFMSCYAGCLRSGDYH